jgi:hypothetical protein
MNGCPISYRISLTEQAAIMEIELTSEAAWYTRTVKLLPLGVE